MLLLTELSIPRDHVRTTVMTTDPLVACDQGYAVKTWLSCHPEFRIRPWRQFDAGTATRVLGWSSSRLPSSLPDGVRTGTSPFHLAADEVVRLEGDVVALRRTKNIERDAAKGFADPAVAYAVWFGEQLADLDGVAEVLEASVIGWRSEKVVRKVARGVHKRVVPQLLPVVSVAIRVRVLDAKAFAAWLLKGVGRHKAFGYGGLFPC